MPEKIPVLVCGGAGYIGSHVTALLCEKQLYEPVVFDNLVTGHAEAVPEGVTLVEGDVRDTELLTRTLKEHRVQCVIHLCAYSLVGESMAEPLKYYDNNVCGAISLLRAMQAAGVSNLVFSSTAATYGEPERVPISEDDRTEPINPYGRSKLMIEQIIRSCPFINAIAFRYFNVAGAGYGVGEMHDCETHLIPILVKRAMEGQKAAVFGDDYDTRDGTCVRDYIHVLDLADAHEMGVRHLLAGGVAGLVVINLGTNDGLSVREIVSEVQKLMPLEVETKGRRPGDPAKLVANPERAYQVLGWRARRSVAEIIQSAVRFHTQEEKALRARGAK